MDALSEAKRQATPTRVNRAVWGKGATLGAQVYSSLHRGPLGIFQQGYFHLVRLSEKRPKNPRMHPLEHLFAKVPLRGFGHQLSGRINVYNPNMANHAPKPQPIMTNDHGGPHQLGRGRFPSTTWRAISVQSVPTSPVAPGFGQQVLDGVACDRGLHIFWWDLVNHDMAGKFDELFKRMDARDKKENVAFGTNVHILSRNGPFLALQWKPHLGALRKAFPSTLLFMACWKIEPERQGGPKVLWELTQGNDVDGDHADDCDNNADGHNGANANIK